MSAQVAHIAVDELGDIPVAQAITVRGKELAADATVADAREVLASGSAQLLPLLDGDAYVGALTKDAIPPDAPDTAPARSFIVPAPTAPASLNLRAALELLDADGGRRLIVLGDDGVSYVGVLCLRRDRTHLCVDAECHPRPR